MRALGKLGLMTFSLFLGVLGCGQEYFQQELAYEIEVSLDDKDHRLNALMQLEYTNNSPDALDFIYFHLWPNAYDHYGTALVDQSDESGNFKLHFSTEEERGSISGLRWTVDGEEASFEFPDGVKDYGKLLLKEPLLPGKSCFIRTPFQVKIPSSDFSRMGHVGESYQVTQWYPKPAVYDHKGWHPMPYLNQGEFFSEFGSFKVEITVPDNYIIGATGELQNEEEKAFLLTKSRSEMIRDNNSFPPSSATTKTLTYTQDRVHDFAWFADKRFNVLHERIAIPNSQDSIDGWVLFTNAHKAAWLKSMEYLRGGIQHYSRLVGAYPYSQCTVIDGTLSAGGGMEYPMITVINGTSNDMALEQVIVHEVGHNWFYGILASNERDHAWMDEGINTYYETRYFEEKYPEGGEGLLGRLGLFGRGIHESGYLMNACRHSDQGLEVGSADFTETNYGVMVYSKGGYIMNHLSSVLGQEAFDSAMHDYYRNWSFKHPYPEDLVKSLETSSGQSLDWYSMYLANGNAKLDYRLHVENIDEKDGFECITLRERHDYPVPARLTLFKEGALKESVVLTPGESVEVNVEETDRVVLDADHSTLDVARKNNEARTNGLLKTWQRPQIKLLSAVQPAESPTLYLSPVLGYNGNDKWMPGLYLSNRELLAKDFEFSLLPLLGTGSEEFVGMGDVVKTFYPNDGPSHFDVAVNYRRFSSGIRGTDLAGNEVQGDQSVYSAFRPSLSYVYVPLGLKKGEHRFIYSYHRIENNWNTISANYTDLALSLSLDLVDEYHVLSYAHQRTEGLTEWAVNSEIEGHSTYGKVEVSLAASHAFNDREDRFSWRVYGAKMWVGDEPIPFGAALDLSGQDGSVNLDGTSEDYRYEQLFLHRNGGGSLAANQMVRNRGGFVQTSAIGGSDDWVLSLNLEADLPVGLPISLYANGGLYPVIEVAQGGSSESQFAEFIYETGVRLNLIPDVLDLSFPLLISEEIKDAYDFNGISYNQTIRLQFRLEKLNIRDLRKAIDR